MAVQASLSDGWALIPAAGVGSRLRPHTHATPKPLLHVAGKPILAYILDEVVRLGIRKIVLVVGYLGDQITAYAKTHYPDCEIVSIQQDEPQGLGHAVLLAKDCTQGQPLLIIFSDTVFDANLAEAASVDADGVIGVRSVEDPSRFGVVKLEGNRIVELVEKPETFVSDLALVGINFIRESSQLFGCLEELIAKNMRTRGEYQLTDAFNLMVQQGADLKIFPIDNWYDCGAPDTLLETNRALLGKLSAPESRDGVILIPPVFVSGTARVTNSIVGPYASVGDDAVVVDSLIRDSIVGEGAQVRGCFLEQSLVGTNAIVEESARRLNVGDSSELRLF